MNINPAGGIKNVLWFYGLSGSGKTTLANLLKSELINDGHAVIILDGDELRAGINKDLGFSPDDRIENIRRASELAKLLSRDNIVVICAFITPLKEHRTLARNIIGDPFFEVFINCPIEVCEQRDVKGLYKLSRTRRIKNFTGIDAKFEAEGNADLVVNTAETTPQQSTALLLNIIRGGLIL